MPIMKDSRLPDDWLTRAVAGNPFAKQENGMWRTCPVRLSFVHAVKPNPNAKNDDGTPRADPQYEITMLCPPGAQEQINALVWPEVYQMLRAEFPGDFDASGQPMRLHIPWRDQHEKAHKYKGYTSGFPFLRATTKFKPQIVDPAGNPIVDENRVYAGVWAIVSLNFYVFGKSPPRPKKGVSMSFSGIMLVADDEKLSGGAPDAAMQFKGVNIDAHFDPSAAFGAQPGAPPMPGSIMPPPTPVAPAYAPPPAPGYAPPPAPGYAPPAPSAAPPMPSIADMLR